MIDVAESFISLSPNMTISSLDFLFDLSYSNGIYIMQFAKFGHYFVIIIQEVFYCSYICYLNNFVYEFLPCNLFHSYFHNKYTC